MIKNSLPQAPLESIIFENERLYICLALYPLTKGHSIVVWKKEVPDLRNLSDDEYNYFMEIVDVVRDTLLDALHVEKVYLLYMDEVKHIHFHLVPRYDEQGMNVLAHNPEKTEDFSLVPALYEAFQKKLDARKIK
jgi:diadenosine tetraphosphate (Ap4A) HIT family hydrolase